MSEDRRTTMEIRELVVEVNERWRRQDNPCSGSDPRHALVHLTKALGKVAGALNDAEHEGRDMRPEEVGKYLADLVICAARLAGGVPGMDLAGACEARLLEKFPVAGPACYVQVLPGAESGFLP